MQTESERACLWKKQRRGEGRGSSGIALYARVRWPMLFTQREGEQMGEEEKGRERVLVGGLEEHNRTLAVCQSVLMSAERERETDEEGVL